MPPKWMQQEDAELRALGCTVRNGRIWTPAGVYYGTRGQWLDLPAAAQDQLRARWREQGAVASRATPAGGGESSGVGDGASTSSASLF